MTRARLINVAAVTVILGGAYAGCAMAAAITGYPPPISGVVVLALAFVFFGAFDGAFTAAVAARTWVREWRHRRYVRARDAAYEDYGITFRVGSPPSDRAEPQTLREAA